jgi:hypothetical protein
MATYTSYDQVGLREDVSDIITDISPTDTPMVSMIKTQKVHNRVYQYQTDSLAAAASNAQIEGADPTMATLTATTMISGNTQILTKAFQISATSDAVSTYGRAKETAYQLGRALKEIKRDLEYAYVGASNAAVVGNNTSGGTAREMDSADQLIDASTTTAGGTAALTEAMLLSTGQAVFNAGGDPSVFMIKPADAQIVAGFTGASGRYRNFNDAQKTLTNVIDLYVSPYGEYKVVLNRHQMTTHAFLLDPSMWRSAVLRPFSRTLLARTGDSEKHFVVGEYGLMHMNPKGSGQINALT